MKRSLTPLHGLHNRLVKLIIILVAQRVDMLCLSCQLDLQRRVQRDICTSAPSQPGRQLQPLPSLDYSLACSKTEDDIHALSQKTHQPLFDLHFCDIWSTFSRGICQPRPIRISTTPRSLCRVPDSQTNPYLSRLYDIATTPPAIPCNSTGRITWMKTRTQQARDRTARQVSESEPHNTSSDSGPHLEAISLHEYRPKRKQAALVKDEEFDCLLEDRVGTSHISELRLDTDLVAFLDVDGLGLTGEIDMLVDGGAGGHV
jgi:hypothetical protein